MKKIMLFVLLFSISLVHFGQEDETPKPATPIPEPEIFETQQSVTIEGQTIDLIARAGTMTLKDEGNKPIALFGFTSYTKKGAGSDRPIVFAYNGGPGSSSVPLHIGILGPKRMVMNDPGLTPAAPYEMVNNEYSILDIADLVMVDPVGTGLSIAVGEASYEDFWGIDQDVRSISLFIKQYLIKNGRMNSPKFLLGESYGTFRNAGIMDHLLDKGIALNGVIMVSAVFDLRTLLFPPNDDLPYIVHVPTYAATAWYHDVLANKPEALEPFLDEVREYVKTTYAPALFKGDGLTTAEIDQLALELEHYTGIKKNIWKRANLRLHRSEFLQELLRDTGETVDRLDSRYKGISPDQLSQYAEWEPFIAYSMPPFNAGFLNYYYEELKVSRDLNYHVSAMDGDEPFKWDWKRTAGNPWGVSIAINTGPDMATAMMKDPNLKVLILNGYFDNGTIFYGVEHTIDHLGLRPEIKENIIMKYYEAGHMMYLHDGSIGKFREDVSSFIKDALR